MVSIARVRQAVALLLAATLTLPAYTCDGYRAPSGELVNKIPAGADSAGYVVAEVPHRPIEHIDLTSSDFWLRLVAYTWGLALLGLRATWPARRSAVPLVVLELLLPVAGAWIILAVVVVGDTAYGTVLALSATGLLWLLALGPLLRRARRTDAASGG